MWSVFHGHSLPCIVMHTFRRAVDLDSNPHFMVKKSQYALILTGSSYLLIEPRPSSIGSSHFYKAFDTGSGALTHVHFHMS